MSVPARPSPGKARPYEFPAVHRHKLGNGVRLLVAPVPRLPLVTVTATYAFQPLGGNLASFLGLTMPTSFTATAQMRAL